MWPKNITTTNLFKPNEKFNSKITVLVSYSVHHNVWELWLVIREFPIAAKLNPSLKSRFLWEFNRFSWVKKFSQVEN